MEDQKIRHYKIEDRGNLRNIPSSDWPKAYEKVRRPSNLIHMTPHQWAVSELPSCLTQYLQDLNCPFGVQERKEAVDWLLGLAVRYEYGDNGEMQDLTVEVSLMTSGWGYNQRKKRFGAVRNISCEPLLQI